MGLTGFKHVIQRSSIDNFKSTAFMQTAIHKQTNKQTKKQTKQEQLGFNLTERTTYRNRMTRI
jgi:hypothetical protein